MRILTSSAIGRRETTEGSGVVNASEALSIRMTTGGGATAIRATSAGVVIVRPSSGGTTNETTITHATGMISETSGINRVTAPGKGRVSSANSTLICGRLIFSRRITEFR